MSLSGISRLNSKDNIPDFFTLSYGKIKILVICSFSIRTIICVGTAKDVFLRLRLHGAIYLPDSFALMPRYCANLKAIRHELASLNRLVTDKSHRVIVALVIQSKNLEKNLMEIVLKIVFLKGLSEIKGRFLIL